MNERLKASMHTELVAKAGGRWFWIAIVVFYALLWALSSVPGITELGKDHTWPVVVVGIVSLGIGAVSRPVLRRSKMEQLTEFDDDELRYAYDEMKRRELFWNLAFWISVAGAIIFFVINK
jgi:hypothetical protein